MLLLLTFLRTSYELDPHEYIYLYIFYTYYLIDTEQFSTPV
jgi:hypothetical protein